MLLGNNLFAQMKNNSVSLYFFCCQDTPGFCTYIQVWTHSLHSTHLQHCSGTRHGTLSHRNLGFIYILEFVMLGMIIVEIILINKTNQYNNWNWSLFIQGWIDSYQGVFSHNFLSILNWQVINYSFKIPHLSHIYTIMVIVIITAKPHINLHSSFAR